MKGKLVAAQFDWPSFVYWSQKKKPEDLKAYLRKIRDIDADRVYFRTSFAGTVAYFGKVEYAIPEVRADRKIEPEAGDLMAPDFADVMEFDFLEVAVKESQRLGMELHPWITPLYEGIHGSNYGGKFAGQHRDFWCKLANGEILEWHPSLAYPEVRAHQMDLIGEMVSLYGVKGVHLDFVRMTRSLADLRDKSHASMMGYDPPLVEAFKTESGKDPAVVGNKNEDWIRFRADRTYTQYLRDLKARFGGELEVSVLTIEANNLGGCLFDWQTWAREGLVDVICPVPGAVPFHAYLFCDAVHIFKKHVGDRAKVLEFVGIDGDAGPYALNGMADPIIPPRPALALLTVESALGRGADGVMFWEADGFDSVDYWEPAAAIVRKVREYES